MGDEVNVVGCAVEEVVDGAAEDGGCEGPAELGDDFGLKKRLIYRQLVFV
jgi:hypothetical protein